MFGSFLNKSGALYFEVILTLQTILDSTYLTSNKRTQTNAFLKSIQRQTDEFVNLMNKKLEDSNLDLWVEEELPRKASRNKKKNNGW